jgi:3-hydroxyisobutyrate dehydrogenase-like beta-hydroxyacid dehydrogenase
MKIGLVGTGTMGNPMARCLIEAGHELALIGKYTEPRSPHFPLPLWGRGLG